MRKTLLLLALLFSFSVTAQAMMPISENMVKEAQVYGVKHKTLTTEAMLIASPWYVADSKKTNRYANGEHVIVYTPYLATAISAQVKAKRNELVVPADGLKVAQEYDGILAVGAVMDSSFKVEEKMLRTYVKQGTNIVYPYSVNLDTATAQTIVVDKKIYAASGSVSAASGVDKASLATVKKEVEAKGKAAVQGKATKGKVAAPASQTMSIKLWNMQYFLYFDLAKLNPQLPMELYISDQAAGDRVFPLNLTTLK